MAALSGKTALVIEDNQRTAETIALYLRDAGMQVETRADGLSGLEAAGRCACDVVVLDWMLPGLDGIGVCRRLRRQSTVPIIMLTAKGHENDLVAALDAGADDFIRKPFSGRELVARAASNIRGRDPFLQVGIIDVGAFTIDTNSYEVSGNRGCCKLTRTEFHILKTLASAPGRLFTRAQLIQLALGDQYDKIERNIDTHISNIRRKIGEDRYKPRHIVAEVGVGYRFMP